VLDGVYVPGSQLGETQKRFVDELRTAGEISETRDEIADVNVVAVNRGEATVTLTYTVLEVTVRDSKTRKVKDVADEPTRTAFRVTLRRIHNRWLVDQLFDESGG
jgi:hypothetical protein